ncbi:CarD family transcriptional regulator [Paenibacillus xylaniclasticus]|uniref:CarD family transcriptional regulator n=1 Tax=Paenibacillus xylaniclasticus TaxID=588083 RepID=UPI000FDC7BBE|nr:MULTISPECIES: CarD family transcriptional regulator [Paenibacillus]GFN32952.1 CarD family transcriptional regulator [Paenibacillus curdlanolyticus]
MFEVGSLIIYSAHGICRIDGISEKTISGVSKHYYDLHPLRSAGLKISIPVDNDSILMLDLIERDEAEVIIESFRSPGVEWIDKSSDRNHTYSNILNSGDRKEIAKVINTLMRQKHKLQSNHKKLNQQDQNMLNSTQQILFNEIAISLDTTYDAILDRVNRIVEAVFHSEERVLSHSGR